MTGTDPSPEIAPTSPPVNPPWVTKVVLGLVALVWIMAVISIVRGGDWPESIGAAALATLCLSAVDLNLNPKRKRSPKG